MAAGDPEIPHWRSAPPCRSRSTSLSGSVSSSTSMNENALPASGHRAAARCGRFRAPRHPRRAVHGDQRIRGLRAERLRKGDFLFRGSGAPLRDPARRTARPVARQQLHQRPRDPLRSRRRSAPVSTSPRIARRESRCETPNAPCPQLGRIAIPERERARHRPFAGLRRHVEHERVGWIERDGAQELHSRGPPSFGIEPGRRCASAFISPAARSCLSRSGGAKDHRCHRSAAGLPFARKPTSELARDAVEPVGLPGIEAPSDAAQSFPSPESRRPHQNPPAPARKRADKRRLPVGHRDRSDHGAEHQPGGGSSSFAD